MSETPMPLWEVFIRNRSGLPHKHCGSVHAPDAEIALRHAAPTTRSSINVNAHRRAGDSNSA